MSAAIGRLVYWFAELLVDSKNFEESIERAATDVANRIEAIAMSNDGYPAFPARGTELMGGRRTAATSSRLRAALE